MLHSCQKPQYKDFRVFGCQSEKRLIFISMKTKHPIHIVVCGVVTSNSGVMPLFIFPHGFRFNMEVYIKCLEEVVLPWIKRVAAEKFYIWQKDYVPCNTSGKTQCWMSENFCDHIWLPNSPDCSPLDYYVWSVIEQETYKTPCNTKDELKAKIRTAFTN